MASKEVGLLSNSESINAVDLGRRGAGVSLVSKRGSTQTMVKAPKKWLSVKWRMFGFLDSGEVRSEAAIL